MSDSINKRIALLIKGLGLNNNSFAKAIDVNPAVTFNIISGRNTKPSYDLLEKIVFTYDNINTDWLLKGAGKMFVDEKRDVGKCSEVQSKQKEIIAMMIDQLEKAHKTNEELIAIIKNLSKE